ncbi:MAG: methionyl-tRNA formyltransferase [Acidimicrobiia bacterium]
MRLVFLGGPADAVPPLSALHDAGHDIALVITGPDRRRGRGGAAEPSPVKRRAQELGLPVVTPTKTGEVLHDIAATGADLGVVVAFGQLIPPSVLDAIGGGYVNVHFSLLPRWRGAAPVERAMLAGDTETGVCLMRLEAGLDTGPVYATETISIVDGETAGELRARLVEVGTALLVERIDAIPGIEPVEQVGEPTYAHKLTVEEFALDWARPARELSRTVLAGNPKPGAWTHAAGRRLKILRAHVLGDTPGVLGDTPGPGVLGDTPGPGVLGDTPGPGPDEGTQPAGDTPAGTIVGPARVATGSGVLVLDQVQPETKAVMEGRAWAAGFRGARLGGD